ncbi:MAG: ABC transporter permease [Planctomycetota bacterium]
MRYATEVEQLPGVQQVLPVKLYMNSCQVNVDLATFYGVPADEVATFFPALHAAPGTIGDFQSRPDGAMVGAQLARRKGWHVGDDIKVATVQARVVGIFDTGGSFLDNVVFTHLDHLQLSTDGKLGIVSEHLVQVAPGTDTDALARRIDELFSRDQRATQTRRIGDFVGRTLSELSELVRFAQVLGYAAVLVMALVLANTVFMSAQARRAELAVLQVLGVTRTGLAVVMLGEAMLLAIVGGVIGVGSVAAMLAIVPQGLGVEGYQVDFVVTPGLMLEGLAFTLLIGLAAGVGPATQAATTSVSNALRPE